MKNTMKKTVCLLLAVLLFAGLSATAFADAGCGNKAPAAYEVLVTDEAGNPVKGVTIQFCSDTTCTMGKTDENGVAVFEMEEGPIYTIHVLKVPEGYVKNGTEYQTDDTYCDVYIPLDKAE